jgi:hypothetical protein
MRERRDARLAELTTLPVEDRPAAGGAAEEELVEAVSDADAAGKPLLVIGGAGSPEVTASGLPAPIPEAVGSQPGRRRLVLAVVWAELTC